MARLMWKSPKAFRSAVWRGTRQDRWRNYSHPKYRRIVNDWTAREHRVGLSTDELLAGVQELVDAAAEYYTAVQTIIPVAATSEVLFTRFYDAVVRGKDDPPAQVFLLGFDSEPIRAEKSLYDLATWTRDPSGAGRVAVRHCRRRNSSSRRPRRKIRYGMSGTPGSRPTSTRTGTPSTTSTS